MTDNNEPLLLGLCADLANKYHGDVVLIRIVVLLLILSLGIGPGFVLYFAISMIRNQMKEDDEEFERNLKSIKSTIESLQNKKVDK